MPRRPLLTPECRAILVQCKKMGMTDKAACGVANIGYSTFYRWMQDAETQKRGDKRELLDELMRARALGQQSLLASVLTAAQGGALLGKDGLPIKDRKGNVVRQPGDWKAAQWLLSVMDSETYGRQMEVKHSGKVGGPMRLEVGSLKGMSEAQLRALAGEGADGDDDDTE